MCKKLPSGCSGKRVGMVTASEADPVWRGGAMAEEGVIVDSDLDFSRAVAGTSAPREILDNLCLVDVRYCGFDGRRHRGQLVVHRDLAEELRELFALMERWCFPVAGVAPIVCFGWSDEASMSADNSSAFNYRFIAGTVRLSRHALGPGGGHQPARKPGDISRTAASSRRGVYGDPVMPGTFTEDHTVVGAFREKGWRWGGNFTHIRDYHHFEKTGSEGLPEADCRTRSSRQTENKLIKN